MKSFNKIFGLAIASLALAVASAAVVFPSNVFADKTLHIKCDDGTPLTVEVPDSQVTNYDYDTACSDHGGGTGRSDACTGTFFAIPAWYNGLQDKGAKCQFQPIRDGSDGQTGDVDLTKTIMRIGMNVFQAALVVAGYAAVLFIIIGGFRYMLAAGDPGAMASSKKTITNAIIGLVIAVLAASIVNAVAGIIK